MVDKVDHRGGTERKAIGKMQLQEYKWRQQRKCRKPKYLRAPDTRVLLY